MSSFRRQSTHGVALLVSVGALVAGACSSSDDAATPASDQAGVTIIATTSIWADVVDNLACGEGVEVATLMPPGSDPHVYEPSLADREDLEMADLVVVNGRDLESGLTDTLEALPADAPVVFTMTDAVDEFVEEDHDEDDHEDEHDGEDEHDDEVEDAHEGHDHGGEDPHIWFDPTLVAELLPALAETLITDAGLERVEVESCLADYQAELEALDTDMSEILSVIPDGQRQLVTNHDSLEFFAERYGLEVVGTVLPSTSSLAEANTADLDELADTMEELGVPAVFTERQHSNDDAEALADRLGVSVIELDTGSLGPDGSETTTYVDLLRVTATRIADGLTPGT